ncbi:MAG: hypothetical protein CMO55_08200 [Verrucomicrobiales bacterium]|nr:hypothetical protein [Verrucomicrobiales bacterium]
MDHYKYIGSPEFLPQGEFPPRWKVDSLDSVADWMNDHVGEMDLEECIAATFVVSTIEELWIAERATEHVACARQKPVLCAGEIFFSGVGDVPFVERVTNQSTGYCPRPESFTALAIAFETIGISHPDCFEPEFEFRRCRDCGTLAIVKEQEFTCLVCDSELPEEWNLSEE